MSKELDELKLQLEEMRNKIEKLENKEKEESKKWWIPEDGNYCYYVNNYGEVEETRYNNNLNTGIMFLNSLNYYKTKEQAERKAFEQLLHRKLEKFAYENNEEEINWNDVSQNKYCLYYNNTNKTLKVDCYSWIKYYGEVCFTSREIAEKCIEEFKDDLIRYFTTDK